VLLLFERMGCEFEGAGVFADRADDVVRDAVGDLGLDFHGDGHFGAVEDGEVLDEFFGDFAGVLADAQGI